MITLKIGSTAVRNRLITSVRLIKRLRPSRRVFLRIVFGIIGLSFGAVAIFSAVVSKPQPANFDGKALRTGDSAGGTHIGITGEGVSGGFFTTQPDRIVSMIGGDSPMLVAINVDKEGCADILAALEAGNRSCDDDPFETLIDISSSGLALMFPESVNVRMGTPIGKAMMITLQKRFR